MRIRDFGITPGRLAPGSLNAVTDVSGVCVGHATVNQSYNSGPCERGRCLNGVRGERRREVPASCTPWRYAGVPGRSSKSSSELCDNSAREG